MISMWGYQPIRPVGSGFYCIFSVLRPSEEPFCYRFLYWQDAEFILGVNSCAHRALLGETVD